MANPGRRQQDVVTNFLRVARVHFGLDQRSPGFAARLRRVGRTVFQSLMVAGSLGGTLGSAANAEPAIPEVRTERLSPAEAQSATQPGERSPVERMP